MPEETNPESVEQTKQVDGSAEGTNPETQSVTETEQESLTPEQVSALTEFQKGMTEAGITDPAAFMADYTKKSQKLKDTEAERDGWMTNYQQTFQQQQQQNYQQDPVGTLQREIQAAEAAYDEPRAQALRGQLVKEQAAEAARQEFARLNQTQQAQQVNQGLRESLKEYGIEANEATVSQLSSRLANDPQALALAMAALHDPSRVEETLLKRRTQREAKAKEQEQIQSLLDHGGARGQVPGSLQDGEREPLRVPTSVYYAFPESTAKKKFGEDAIIVPG